MSGPFAGGSPGPGQANWGQPQQAPPPNQSESGHHIPANLRPAIPPPGMAMGGQSADGSNNGQQYALSGPSRDRQQHMSPGLDRQNSDNSLLSAPDKKGSGGSRRPSASRVCAKCGKSLSGQFVRALDATYHLECFTCHECGKIVASKFFPVPDEGPNQYPLCEKDYFKRLDLICHACNNALRGSYITALDRKYHIEHFTCSVCPTVFGAQDSYYEHEGSVFCHYHYSTRFAQRCHGCHNAILKQFVEIFRNGQNQHWHPECYMIHKYWNVRLHNPDVSAPSIPNRGRSEDDAPEDVRRAIRGDEEQVEEKVLHIWRSLSTFEERAATCISDMLLHVSNGIYFDGIMAARKLIIHIELFFGCTDDLDKRLTVINPKGLSYSREAKLLCKKIVSFFQLLSESQSAGMQRLGVTQELLSLVTGLAHYLKLLIRICLQGALKLERETGSPEGLNSFLDQINTLGERLEQDENRDPIADSAPYVPRTSDSCPVCDKPVEDKCTRRADRVYHYSCLVCKRCGTDLKDNLGDAAWSPSTQEVLCRNDASQVADASMGFFPVTRLQQYIHLLKVAHARLLATLRSMGAIPHTAEDPNLRAYDSGRGIGDGSTVAMLRADARSSSYTGTTDQINQRNSASYEQTLGDIRRLRSTRMDKQLSNTMKRARSSRIIEGPGGVSARPGSSEGPDEKAGNRQNLQIVHDQDPSNRNSQFMGLQSQHLALDDIPRLVQAEVARDQRPNAAKYARNNNIIGQDPQVRLLNGHRRDFSAGTDPNNPAGGEMGPPKKYFSDLTALDYFIVRHLAVLEMEPMLDGHYNQNELIDLIETKRPTFWDRFGKAFKNDKTGGKKKQDKGPGIFGKSLEQIIERDGADSTDGVGPGALRIPAVMENAITAMRNMDMSVEGVFRKNGNNRRLRELIAEIDEKGSEYVDLTKETPVQVANLLKRYLGSLPDPLLTFKLHRLFETAGKISDPEKQRRVLHLSICLLPKAHRDAAEVLFSFLHWVASFHNIDEESGSKMDMRNLSTVISPNVLRSSNEIPTLNESMVAIESVIGLIEWPEIIAEVPESLISILTDATFIDGGAELTTKEIMRRHGKVKATQASISPGPPMSSNGRQAQTQGRTGAVTHVAQDTQPWQNESSVRHIGQGNMNYGPSSNTPPTAFSNEPGQTSSPQRQSQFRSNAFPNQGPLGITGAN